MALLTLLPPILPSLILHFLPPLLLWTPFSYANVLGPSHHRVFEHTILTFWEDLDLLLCLINSTSSSDSSSSVIFSEKILPRLPMLVIRCPRKFIFLQSMYLYER